jgi:hypothetical protein
VVALDHEERARLGRLDHRVDAVVPRLLGREHARTQGLDVVRVDVDEADGHDLASVGHPRPERMRVGTPNPALGYHASTKSAYVFPSRHRLTNTTSEHANPSRGFGAAP